MDAPELMDPPDIVRAVYAALCSLDPAEMSRVGGEYFDDDIVVREPESLPWGGFHQGKELVIGLMAGIGDPASPIDAANLSIDNVIHTPDGDLHQVIAAVSFPWRGADPEPGHMRALEWFTVRAGKVTEIRIYLWDTAAGIAALQPTRRSCPGCRGA
jgi:ketosteroid isomerase-like protein